MVRKRKRITEEKVYKVTFDNKKDARRRIEYLIDIHGEETPYVECKGCPYCDEIEDIRKSFMGEIVGKITQKRIKGYKQRVLTDEVREDIVSMLEHGYTVREIALELAVSLNTVEFFRREWMKKSSDGRQS